MQVTDSSLFPKWKKWSPFSFHISFFCLIFAPVYRRITFLNFMAMKRTVMMLAFCGMVLTALADWTYGTACFTGSQPSSCLNHGGVMIWYDGDLKQTGNNGGEEIWQGTGDICVAYPKNYNGPKMRFLSKGGTVQIQYLK